jgi:hypothetical protein
LGPFREAAGAFPGGSGAINYGTDAMIYGDFAVNERTGATIFLAFRFGSVRGRPSP